MFSDMIKSALETEVIGQPRAVNSVVRGVTRAAGGLVPREGPLCAYMFIGPSGSGKTHLVQTLARTMHGGEQRLAIADCTHLGHGDPWRELTGQLAPLFTWSAMAGKWSVLESPPLSIILIEYLERGRPEVVKALAVALETGQILLPEGRRGSIRSSLVFITSGLCSKEILDEGPRIGFSGSPEEEDNEQARIFKLCYAAAQKQYGTNLLARLDDLIVFHRLQEEFLDPILDRLIQNLNRWLRGRGFHCEVSDEARAFLMERGRRHLHAGARELLRAHRRFVEFPVADLAISGRIPPGGTVMAGKKPDEDHLHFTVGGPAPGTLPPEEPCVVPVRWEGAGA